MALCELSGSNLRNNLWPSLKTTKIIYGLAMCASLIFILKFSLHQTLDKDYFNHKKSEYDRRLRFQAGQVCICPQLEANHSSVNQFFRGNIDIECSEERNWVYVENGTFRITQESKRRHGTVLCEYVPLLRESDDFHTTDGQHIKPMHDGTLLHGDFFKVNCTSQDQRTYFNIHSGIGYNAAAHARGAASTPPHSAMGVSVLIIGFDSVSRMTWMRKLPQTHSYFTKTLKGTVLEGYNVVGDGTVHALLSMLTGKTEKELPQARKWHPNATTVDKHPWIWKKFEKQGYITQWAEDMARSGVVTNKMLGFKDPPVDHYMRPFYLEAEKIVSYFKPDCFGSLPSHVNFLNWFKDSFVMYGNKRKFMFGFHTEYTHDYTNKLQNADSYLQYFLKFLVQGGYLDQTVLIMMSDHGFRFQKFRETAQGYLEQRMPYFAFRFPPWFETKYPLAMKNFRTNAYRLTTPFDIHETFQDILNYKSVRKGDLSKRGISLFQEIPKERSCAHAGIKPHWCACLMWDTISSDDEDGKRAVEEAINAINSYIEPVIDQCSRLSLGKITRMVRYSPNQNDNRSNLHGRVSDLSGHRIYSDTLYQVTFSTQPGNGHFEVTVWHNADKHIFTVHENEISRINKYGEDPACITNTLPHLRPYCYCIGNEL